MKGERFEHREAAGRKLGRHLRELEVRPDIVLGIPRGGLPVGREVADILDVKLGVAVAKKITSRDKPELALGAVGAFGAVWVNEDLAKRHSNDLDRDTERAQEAAERKLGLYQEEELDVGGRKVVLVDDGMATGATMLACVRDLKDLGAEKVVVAVPVASESSVDLLKSESDRVIALEVPRFFDSVGRFYRDFEQVSDEEAKNYLDS